jgi:hypothetical protein
MTPQYILRKSLCRPPHCGARDKLGNDDKERNLRSAESEIENLGFATGYAEPGYTDPAKGILFANWNYFPRGLDSILERAGYAIEWSDEWSTCGDCGLAVRSSPDSYGWQPSYAILGECDLLCSDCLANHAAEYLEGLEDNPRTALNLPAIDPADHGYTRIQDGFESGFHPGQTDDPTKILAELQAKGHKRILFQIDDVGQFDTRFSVWERTES